MYLLVIYDISSDKKRNAIAEICKDYGLERVQWSAFCGQLGRNRREEMRLKMSEVLGESKGNIRMYVICKKDLRMMKEITNGDD